MGNNVAIRSSAWAEDKNSQAMAGVYHSALNIPSNDDDKLNEAINKVIKSYHNLNETGLNNQILVQQMIDEVSMSGVVFTQDMKSGAPYYVINYDDKTGRTDTVTSGSSYGNHTLFVFRDAVSELSSERFILLLRAIQEIEDITNYNALDIEFALKKNLKVSILQVRKITTRPNWNRGISLKIQDTIQRIRHFVSDRYKPYPGWYGDSSIFAQMSDWNPAEIIGATPRPLALSLYRYLITDSTWRIAREQMGYAVPKGAPLMVSLAGQPFIDVRLSFHSYLPKGLKHEIGDRLVNAWIERLRNNNELHDKVEFDIAITSLTFDFQSLTKKLISGVLSSGDQAEFREALFDLTNSLLLGKTASISGELEKIKKLGKRRDELLLSDYSPKLHLISALLEDCIILGTIPFSILARHGFIAKSFLHSLVKRGVLTEIEANIFQRSIKTVATDFVYDLKQVASGSLSIDQLINKYGHLRQGTYDILSLRYDQRKDLLMELIRRPVLMDPQEKFHFSNKQIVQIQKLCKEFGYDIEPEHFISYIIEAITAREYAKFQFSRNLSDALELITQWGEQVGLSRDELSYLTINQIIDSHILSEGRTLEQHIRKYSNSAKEDHEITKALHLPHVINTTADVSIVPLLLTRPNFITQKVIHGSTVFLDNYKQEVDDISGKIVLIENADPGFDWIFACSIIGLVTKFGGVNSHMAIRCAEFDLPAAIGCGQQIFDFLLRTNTVEINCSEERIVSIEG